MAEIPGAYNSHLGLKSLKLFLLHQKTVLRQLMVQSQASCHGGSTFGGAATNSMSGIESDTFVETLSISPHWFETCSFQFNFFPSLCSSKKDKKDLINCFDFSKKCDEAWKLPIAQRKEEILEKVNSSVIGAVCRLYEFRSLTSIYIQIAENQVVVLSGPTGCGKSTQVI